ncbi:MAG: ABC transporter permease, partial [Bacilli bacterium]|nr:ABC transporter permease [Bacilli bacterium]
MHTLLESQYVRNYSITTSAYLWQDNREIKFSEEYIKHHPDYKDEHSYMNEEGVEVKYNPTSGIHIYKIGDYAYRKYLNDLGLSYDEMKNNGILVNIYETTVLEDGQYISKQIGLYGYQPGDILSWKPSEHDSEEHPELVPATIDIEIGYVTDKSPFGLNRSNWKTDTIIVSDEFYEEHFNYLDYQFMWVYIDSTNPLKFHEEIENTLVNYHYNIENHEKEIKDKSNLYILLALFIYGFIIIISIIGLTSIINTITTNKELRSREFATLRSIGMTQAEFYRMIRLESLFYGLKSLIIGIPLGIIFSYTIFYKFAMANLASVVYKFPTRAIVIVILTIFILVMIIMRYSINKINKQNIIETIRNENI